MSVEEQSGEAAPARGRRSRGGGGGAAGRRQARGGLNLKSLPYIHRQLEPTDILSLEAIEIIESICMFMVVLVAFFSMFAVFFSSRRAARKAGVAVWNAASKKQFGLYAIAIILGIFLLSLAKNTAVNYAAPFFLGYLLTRVCQILL